MQTKYDVIFLLLDSRIFMMFFSFLFSLAPTKPHFGIVSDTVRYNVLILIILLFRCDNILLIILIFTMKGQLTLKPQPPRWQ